MSWVVESPKVRKSFSESGQIKNPAKNHGVFLLQCFGASKKDLRKFRCVFKIPEKSVKVSQS